MRGINLLLLPYAVCLVPVRCTNLQRVLSKVVFNDNVFSFTASGEHSGNKYEYTLDLDCFDAIDEADSTWSSSSVGRFTAILAKRRMRRWPRLLLDKKKKGTGRLDMMRQDELDKEDHG